MRNITYIYIFFLVFSFNAESQFYNGHQMHFGKNRVQYNDFIWTYNEYDRFDIYYNQEGKEIASFIAEYAEDELFRIEQFFEYKLERKIVFITYNKQSDFRQSNIGLVSGSDNNLGGVTHIVSNKVFIYFEGDYNQLKKQISARIAEVIINEILYGSDITENVKNSVLINLPEWYVKGLVSYVSENWSVETENIIKDGILSGRYEKFNRLSGNDAMYAGHSIWNYIVNIYGKPTIPSIIYMTRINKNANSGFMYTIGSGFKAMSYDWFGYYKSMFEYSAKMAEEPETGKIIKKPRKKNVYKELKISPDGKYAAYITNTMGKYKILLYDIKTGKRKKILRKGHKLDQITDYSYPILAWHPSGELLSFITEEKGEVVYYYYSLNDNEFVKRNLPMFEKIIDYSFSHDGLKLVLSAMQKGKTDIYVYNIIGGVTEQITNDISDDINPQFIDNSTRIIFSSNRNNDTLTENMDSKYISPVYSLYIYDYHNKDKILKKLSSDKYVSNILPEEIQQNKYINLSDATGTINRYLNTYDSTIVGVDTITHFRYFSNTFPLTNYSRNIIEHDYSKAGLCGEIIYNKGKYHMYVNTFSDSTARPKNIVYSEFRQKLNDMLNKKEMEFINTQKISIEKVKDSLIIINNTDTINLYPSRIDFNNYLFESEKLDFYNNKYSKYNINLTLDSTKNNDISKLRVYKPTFFSSFLVSQVDFSFLNSSYQSFTGNAFYFSPGVNLNFKLGTNDLLEDYKIVGGVRLSLDFDANEYLVSFENIKKRIDKQFVFHRQAFKQQTINGNLIKTHTHEVMGIFSYPFSQVTSVRLTGSARFDRIAYLIGLDASLLDKHSIYRSWLGLKTEYIFDNTKQIETNIYEGIRFKLFAEAYQGVDKFFNNLFVVGADFRYYKVIHRNLIYAGRAAASTSSGSARLVYYLGGVDNWINLASNRIPTFIPLSEIPVDMSKNYVYQAVATNMRGFSQNIRNGPAFTVINNEIRWPIFRYLVNYPISNSFLANFQVVGFFDIGSAWAGLTPYSNKNEYDNVTIPPDGDGNPITIILDSNRDPIVAGYGFGLRTQLLGYFIRLDWAWGIENNTVIPGIWYLSLNLDF